MNYTLYKHTTPSNKVYIGITSMGVKKRWWMEKGYISKDIMGGNSNGELG